MAEPDRSQSGLHCQGGLRGYGFGQPLCLFQQLLGWHHIAQHADLMRSLGAHAFVVAQQPDAHDLAERHFLEHLDGFIDCAHAVGHMRVEEGGVLGRYQDVAFAEQIESPAAGHAVHSGYHRLPEVALLRAEVVARVVEHVRVGGVEHVLLVFAEVGHGFLSVDSCAEGFVARAGEHHSVDFVLCSQRPPDISQLCLHLLVEGVVDLGAVQGDPRHRSLLFVDDGFVA